MEKSQMHRFSDESAKLLSWSPVEPVEGVDVDVS